MVIILLDEIPASQRPVGPFSATPKPTDRLKKPFRITLSDDKENTPLSDKTPNSQRSQFSQRLYGSTPESSQKLVKPFKCPGSATISRTSDKPTRKRRKVDYGGADGDKDDDILRLMAYMLVGFRLIWSEQRLTTVSSLWCRYKWVECALL